MKIVDASEPQMRAMLVIGFVLADVIHRGVKDSVSTVSNKTQTVEHADVLAKMVIQKISDIENE